MRIIVITQPDFFHGEATAIAQMLSDGRADTVHIRKPGATRQEVERLIYHIPSILRHRLVLHDHHDLATAYALGGIHLNSRYPTPPDDWAPTSTGWTRTVDGRRLTVSRSCHSLDELREWRDQCDYLSLSPIFDSISKQGYRAAFTADELRRATAEGLIDSKVMALGGVTFARLAEVERMGFGGGMILGDAWRSIPCVADEEQKSEHDDEEGPVKVVLTIAGSDTSAGAGIQQDLKTVSAMGHYAVTVPTALTAQNTVGVQRVMPVPDDMLRAQLDSIYSDIRVDGIKIGMLPNIGTARLVVEYVKKWREANSALPVVCDPVMVSTSGTPLMADDCIEYIQTNLFPLCTLITPNIPEAMRLLAATSTKTADTGSLPSETNTALVGTTLAARYATAILLKGGHAEGNESVDTLCLPDGTQHRYTSQRITTRNLHGTGCTLSSALATALATGLPLPAAVAQAKGTIQRAILGGLHLHIGKGNGPLFFG